MDEGISATAYYSHGKVPRLTLRIENENLSLEMLANFWEDSLVQLALDKVL